MKPLFFQRSLGVLLWLCVVALPCFAQTPTPTPTPTTYALNDPDVGIFTDGGEMDEDELRDEARTQAATNGVPTYKSNEEETRFYEGYFRAAEATTKLAVLSDDGTSVWIDGVPVLTRANQNQGFENFDSTFTVLSPTFVAGRVYHVRVQYTNTIHQGDADVDGISLWAYDGGGEIVDPTIDADMDVDNTSLDSYPSSINEDRSEEEETAEETKAASIWANTGDHDSDGVPDFADGIDVFDNGQANSCRSFEPLVIQTSINPTLSPNGRYVFRYAGSNPAALNRQMVNGEAQYSLPDANLLRIWKKNGTESRNHNSAHQNGDFLVPDQAYTAEDLGLTGSSALTLFVEILGVTDEDQSLSITVDFYPYGISQTTRVSSDNLKVTGYEFGTVLNPSF